MKHCKVDYRSAWSMPVAVRQWWINKVEKEAEETKRLIEKTQKQ